MTASPLLPPGMTGRMAETEATDAELSRMTELALSRGARAVAIGRGNSPAATRAAAGFARRWESTGGSVICAVTWPESAASWLRQATRFAAADPDLWVMAGPPTGWAQMTRRLLWSTAAEQLMPSHLGQVSGQATVQPGPEAWVPVGLLPAA